MVNGEWLMADLCCGSGNFGFNRYYHSESRNLAAVLELGLRLELGGARLNVYHESKSLAIFAFNPG